MASEASSDDRVEVVKWYTRARRFPQLIGKTADGTTIWGGPYTYTQAGVGAAVLIIGSQTIDWWGQFGLLGNAGILLVAAYGSVLLAGQIPFGMRNPLLVAWGFIGAISAPSQGKFAGRDVRLNRPHVARSTLVDRATQPIPPESVPPDPPEAVTHHPMPALTGVQQLLAAAGAPNREKDY